MMCQTKPHSSKIIILLKLFLDLPNEPFVYTAFETDRWVSIIALLSVTENRQLTWQSICSQQLLALPIFNCNLEGSSVLFSSLQARSPLLCIYIETIVQIQFHISRIFGDLTIFRRYYIFLSLSRKLTHMWDFFSLFFFSFIFPDFQGIDIVSV
jgi:hypothetical protein